MSHPTARPAGQRADAFQLDSEQKISIFALCCPICTFLTALQLLIKLRTNAIVSSRTYLSITPLDRLSCEGLFIYPFNIQQTGVLPQELTTFPIYLCRHSPANCSAWNQPNFAHCRERGQRSPRRLPAPCAAMGLAGSSPQLAFRYIAGNSGAHHSPPPPPPTAAALEPHADPN